MKRITCTDRTIATRVRATLARMAEGLFCLLQAVRDRAAEFRSLERNIEGRNTEHERVGQFSIEGQPLSVRLLVPITQSVYNDLVFLAQRTEGATREADEDVGAALVAASLLLRDCAVLHKPPNTPPLPNPTARPTAKPPRW